MPTLPIDIPEHTPTHLAVAPTAFAATMKLMTALKMYKLGQLDSHEAVALADLPHRMFLAQLRAYQVPPFVRVDPQGTPVPPVTAMTAAAVLAYARMQMPSWQSRRLQELMDQRREVP